jgi:xanthine dehydrogenase accessory factor
MNSHTAAALRAQAQAWVQAGVPALVVQVQHIQGSTPREAGTRMLVSAEQLWGTIGGGHLEWEAIALARHTLAEAGAGWQHTSPFDRRYPLGPTLGQCCGGVVVLRFEPLTPEALATWPTAPARFHLELHGAGHVGQAIVHLLRDLDCTVRWIDQRADTASDDPLLNDRTRLPSPEVLATLPPHIGWHPTDEPTDAVRDAPPGACHLVLTHRHDLDLRIIEAVLRRGDFAFAGLIGSQTKRARFLHRLEAAGLPPDTLARMTCPIGLPGLTGKEPAVIAVSVVAQLLQAFPP